MEEGEAKMDVVNQKECIKLIRDFIDEKLEGDIERIKDFNFNELREDKKYGCTYYNKNKGFDADDTILARAIYCVVWGDTLPDINFNDIGTGKNYRGDIINSFNTLFSRNLNKKLSNIRNNNYTVLEIGNENKSFIVEDEKLKENIIEFHKLYRTIGNMALLPNKSNKNNNINQYRGVRWKDYFDKFLLELRLYFLSDYNNKGFTELLNCNSFYFNRFKKSERGFSEFCKLNFLDYYINNEISFGVNDGNRGLIYPGWQMSRFWSQNENNYNKFAARYIEKSSKIIRYRSNIILEQLIKKVNL